MTPESTVDYKLVLCLLNIMCDIVLLKCPFLFIIILPAYSWDRSLGSGLTMHGSCYQLPRSLIWTSSEWGNQSQIYGVHSIWHHWPCDPVGLYTFLWCFSVWHLIWSCLDCIMPSVLLLGSPSLKQCKCQSTYCTRPLWI